jgi:hypothetical protein
MDPESTRLFNNRLAQWVAKQGVWFQLRYSMAGGGSSVLMYHLLRIALRVAIFLLIVAAVIIVLLVRRTDQREFKKDLGQAIIKGMDASNGKMFGFNRSQNKATIRYLTFDGGNDSFFHNCEATGISFRMGLLDGFTKAWDLNRIAVDRMSIHVKGGAETDSEAQKTGMAFFKEFPNIRFQAIECNNTRIVWGYSPRTMGSISGSQMAMVRDGSGWRMRFTGGTLQQNWMRNLHIDELVLRCDPNGVVIEKGEFTVLLPLKELSATKKHGKVAFQNVKVRGGARPEYSGTITLENIPLEQWVPETYASYVEGSISGQLNISGSTNSSEGVSLSGRISLAENDHIDVRSRLPILNSLSILCPSGSYRKTSFREGAFQVSTSAGALKVTDIQLSAPDQMDLSGAFTVRPPSQEEILDLQRKGIVSSDAAKEIAMPGMSAATALADLQLNLRKVAETKTTENQLTSADTAASGIDFGVPFQADDINIDLQSKTTNLLATSSIYEGRIVMSLPVSKFTENATSLRILPQSNDGNFYLLSCPLIGHLGEITLAQAEELLAIKKKVFTPGGTQEAEQP